MRALKMRCIMGGHRKWPMTNWESLSKLIFLPPHEKLSKDSTLTILQLFGIWSKLERWKSSVSGCLTRWPQIKKNHRSEVSSALIQQQWTISQLDCDMQWKDNCIWQPVTTSSVVGLRSNSKALPKTKPAPKKTSWSLSGGLLQVWFTTAFWIPAKPWHLRSMLNKPMRCTKNYNTGSCYWSTERARFFSMTMPHHMSHDQHFKSWTNWAMKFCLICRIHVTSRQVTTPSLSILTTFCRQNASTTSRRQKCFPRVHGIPKYALLRYRNKQTYISLAKICWL